MARKQGIGNQIHNETVGNEASEEVDQFEPSKT